ncbi:MAG: amidohydrolase family protein [Planctomycetes bacterium]|nr:amidohydrolase family protein [Planctomycetota bacterium]
MSFRPSSRRASASSRAALAALFAAAPTGFAAERPDDVWVIRCGRIETGTGEVIERGAILVEHGVIKAVGLDIEAPLGAREIDARRFTVVPGFVHPTSGIGQDRQRSSGNQAEQRAHTSFYPYYEAFHDALEQGFTTMALQPASQGWLGIAGLSAIVQPTGDDGKKSAGAALLEQDVQLVFTMNSNQQDKDLLRKSLEKVDEAVAKYDEALKKWEEKQKKAKEKKEEPKKEEPKKEEEKKEGEAPKEEAKKEEPKKDEKKEEVFEAPKVDDKTSTLWGWVKGSYPALVRMNRAADYLHWLEVVKERKLRVAFELEGADTYLVADRFGKAGAIVLLDPQVVTYPLTSERLNLPAFFERAGATVGFVPSRRFEEHRHRVAQVVKAGFPREKAIAAMTAIPAASLGIDDRYGSIQPGRFADLVFFDGDPFEVGSQVRKVMIRGTMKFESEKEAQR